MDRLNGKNCIVTGAAAGIGRAIASVFADEGASVVVTDIDVEGAGRVAEALAESGRKAIALGHDAGEEPSWMRLLDEVQSTQGRLDILVNNAASGRAADLEHTSAEDWDRIGRVTSLGVFLGTKLAMARMDHRGSIVNIASIAALRGAFGAGTLAYASAKAAVISISRAAALHCARKRTQIRVNAIAPGLIDTDGLRRVMLKAAGGDETRLGEVRRRMAAGVPLGRVGTPEEVAQAALFLASDEARYVTGQLLAVDGGVTAL